MIRRRVTSRRWEGPAIVWFNTASLLAVAFLVVIPIVTFTNRQLSLPVNPSDSSKSGPPIENLMSGSSWADPVSSVCQEKTPSLSYPLRANELGYNVACSKSMIGPLPPNRDQGGVTKVDGGANPPGFAIYDQFMTYDAADGYVLLFGATGGSGPQNGTEVWTFQEGAWHQLSATPMPEACLGSVLAYDDTDGYVVYFAGGNSTVTGSCQNAGQTWTYRGGAWARLHPSVSPPARQSASFTNDTADGYMVLFGGSCGSAPNNLCNDTWTFRAGAWTNITRGLATKPSPRAGAGFTYDPETRQAILFGGTGWPPNFDLPVSLNDTWGFGDGQWLELQPGVSPPTLFNDGLTYDAAIHGLLYTAPQDNATFNGLYSEMPEISWEFVGGKWVNGTGYRTVNNGDFPSSRLGEGLTYDWADGVAVLYGGTATTWNSLNDTWMWQGGSWVQQLGPASSVRLVAVPSSPELGQGFKVEALTAGSWDLEDAQWTEGGGCTPASTPWGNLLQDGDLVLALDCQANSTKTLRFELWVSPQFGPNVMAQLNITPQSSLLPRSVGYSQSILFVVIGVAIVVAAVAVISVTLLCRRSHKNPVRPEPPVRPGATDPSTPPYGDSR